MPLTIGDDRLVVVRVTTDCLFSLRRFMTTLPARSLGLTLIPMLVLVLLHWALTLAFTGVMRILCVYFGTIWLHCIIRQAYCLIGQRWTNKIRQNGHLGDHFFNC